MGWTIGLIVVIIIVLFLRDVNKDHSDLQGQNAYMKFSILTRLINEAAYNGKGEVTMQGLRDFQLYREPSNQIILFNYGTGNLTIQWRFKYLQQESVYTKTFYNVRECSNVAQSRMANIILEEAHSQFQRHINKILK